MIHSGKIQRLVMLSARPRSVQICLNLSDKLNRTDLYNLSVSMKLQNREVDRCDSLLHLGDISLGEQSELLFLHSFQLGRILYLKCRCKKTLFGSTVQ